MVNLNAGHGLNANGYIVSDVGLDKIDPAFMPCIQESVKRLQEWFDHELHSVYLYGSVARGDAVIAKSDLDLIAMFYGNLSSDQLTELKKIAGELSERYRAFVREVGVAVAYYDYTMDPANYYENAFLKELCVCVYGDDVGEGFGPYKLTPEIAIRFNGDISEVLQRTLSKLETASDKEWRTIIQNFSRKLIRTYYSMVMVRSQVWTTRLSEQAAVFMNYFPEKEHIVCTLIHWTDEPPMDRKTVLELFKREGEWASRNFTREAASST